MILEFLISVILYRDNTECIQLNPPYSNIHECLPGIIGENSFQKIEIHYSNNVGIIVLEDKKGQQATSTATLMKDNCSSNDILLTSKHGIYDPASGKLNIKRAFFWLIDDNQNLVLNIDIPVSKLPPKVEPFQYADDIIKIILTENFSSNLDMHDWEILSVDDNYNFENKDYISYSTFNFQNEKGNSIITYSQNTNKIKKETDKYGNYYYISDLDAPTGASGSPVFSHNQASNKLELLGVISARSSSKSRSCKKFNSIYCHSKISRYQSLKCSHAIKNGADLGL